MRWSDDLTPSERYRWVRGLLRKSRSCGTKQRYPSPAHADRAATAMTTKTGRSFDVYRCLWGRHWHIGGSVRP